MTEAELLRAKCIAGAHLKSVRITILPSYIFYYPELTLFVNYVWERVTWNRPDWQTQLFKCDIEGNSKMLTEVRRQSDQTSCLPTTEIWNDYILDDLFHELLYVVDSRLYESSEDIEKVLAAIERLVSHLKEMARRGIRFAPGEAPIEDAKPVSYYYSELLRGNNFILLECNMSRMVMAMMDNPNFIKSTDPKLTAHLSAVFDRILYRSIPIGKNGERFRDVYFNKLENRYRFFAAKIMSKLKEE
jgi:hypothetical protein